LLELCPNSGPRSSTLTRSERGGARLERCADFGELVLLEGKDDDGGALPCAQTRPVKPANNAKRNQHRMDSFYLYNSRIGSTDLATLAKHKKAGRSGGGSSGLVGISSGEEDKLLLNSFTSKTDCSARSWLALPADSYRLWYWSSGEHPHAGYRHALL